MRIAVYHNQPSGGARRGLHGFCRELARRHHLDMYALSTADQEMLLDADVSPHVVQVDFAPAPPVRFGLYWNDLIQRRNLSALERVNATVADRIDEGAYDVALVDTDRFTFAPYLLKYLRTPSVHYVHHRPRQRAERFCLPPASVYQRARRLWHLPVERWLELSLWRTEVTLVRYATRVVTNSRFSQSRLREIYEVEAAVVPYGVDLPLVFGVREGGYVLSVGELEVRKGFDFVLEAMARVPAKLRPPLHLIANGGNPDVRRRLEAQAVRLGVKLHIRVLPPQSELAAAYRNAEIFVYGAREEALGIAPLEAMAHGIPVVAVGEGGVLETITHGQSGFLTARDPVAFAGRITELLSSPGLRAKMGAAGRLGVERGWTWDLRGRALEWELEQAAGAGHPLEAGAATG
ncbi:MAG: glycosyltransferase family 4 protein [Candidatus Dormibacteraeota bacterium]|nr:glycosyltransferase family 4 protein [Candidatus Dormibacteraeota bacterium]